MSGIIQYMSFYIWFISLTVMFPRSVHVVSYVNISFLFRARQYSIESIDYILLIHAPVDVLMCLRPCFHFFWFGIPLEVGLLGHMAVLCLIF